MTPKIISNIKESISEGDELNFDEIDGWDELAEENREKVRKALEQGHVDDEEWKGVSYSSLDVSILFLAWLEGLESVYVAAPSLQQYVSAYRS